MLSFLELTKNSPTLEGDATDGSFANKHGRHVIGHVDDYCALRQQIGEGKLLVQKILSLIIPACNFPGHKAQCTEVTMSQPSSDLVHSPNMILMFHICQQLRKNFPFAVSRPLLLPLISNVCSTLLQIRLQIK
jgi:hypothetical protein